MRSPLCRVACVSGVLFLAAPQRAPAQCWGWIQIATLGSPPARAGHRMVYDAQRRKVVLFGGYNGDYLGDTWEYDPGATQWSQAFPAVAPLARDEFAMSYDSDRRLTILYSGANTVMLPHHQVGGYTWDGANWTFFNPGGPSSRHGHSTTYDSRRQRTLLFGSKHGETDTWEYDSAANQWSLRAQNFFPPLTFFAMGHDAARARAVVFGGYDSTTKGGPLSVLNTTYEWDGSAWMQKFPVASPAPRFGVAGAYDSLHRRFVVFGGSTGGPLLGDAWSWDGEAWTSLGVSGPPTREYPSIVFDAQRGRIILFGGHNHALGNMGDTWELVPSHTFSAHPAPVSVEENAPASFSVAVAGAGALAYEWRRDETPLPDSNAPTYAIASVAPADAGEYVCVVTTTCGLIYSLPARLTVLEPCPGDANGDRVVNFADLNLVLGAYGHAGAPGTIPGDVNRDGVVNFQDLNIVLSAFGTMC